MSKEPSGAEKMFGGFAPKLVQLTDEVLFGDVWERKELSKRDRSLITVAALVALNRPDQLRFHLGRATENGVKEQELIRGDHAPGVLLRLTKCHDRDDSRQGALFKTVRVT
jgi:4-carboxymuconolactone decarboxylase